MDSKFDLRPYRNEIPAGAMVWGMEAIDRNSQELLDDADLLVANSRYSRAIALAILALEEASKKSVLLPLYAVQHDPELRKKLWRDYKNHQSKSAFLLRRPAFLGKSMGEYFKEKEQIKEKALVIGKRLDMLKQLGFYSDVYESSEGKFWTVPSNTITEEIAKTHIELISNHVRFGFGNSQEKTRENRYLIIAAIDQYPKHEIRNRLQALYKASTNLMKEEHNNDATRNTDEILKSLLDSEVPESSEE